MIVMYYFTESSTLPTYIYVIIVAVVIIAVLMVVILLLLKKLKFGFCMQYYFEKLLVQMFLYDAGCINSGKRNAFFWCLPVCVSVPYPRYSNQLTVRQCLRTDAASTPFLPSLRGPIHLVLYIVA